MSKDIAFVLLIVKNYPNLTKHSNRIYQAYFENENFNFENGIINQEHFISKHLDCNNAIENNCFERADCTNKSKNNNDKPTSAPKDKVLPKREPRSLRKTRFNDDTLKKKESSNSSPEQYNQLATVKSTDPSSICSEIEISTIDDNLNSNSNYQLSSEINNHIDSTQENKLLQNTLSITHNNDNDTSLRKLETELTYFNSNLQPQSQSTLSDLSEINKSDNCFNALATATPNSYTESKNAENSLHSFQSSSDNKITSNNNTSDSIVPESKYYSISIDSINSIEEEKLQSYQRLDHKISNSSTIIPDNKYPANPVSVTESDENDLQSCESLDLKTSFYSSNSTIGSVNSKYDLISFDSQSSQP